MDPDSTYAPQSPDLSADEREPEQPHPQHQYRGSVSHISPFVTPTTDSRSPFQFPQSSSASAEALSHNPFANSLPPQHAINNFPPHHIAMKEEQDYDDQEDYRPSKPKAASRSKRMKMEDADLGSGPAFAEGIEVRTKFPVARIKRIMQADEDVGKVAQVTPVAVSKALELFMISIVTKAAEQARQRSSKRVLASHLKQAVTNEEQFDFLTEIVSKVADAPAPQTKHDGDSDDPMEGVKKKRPAARRKRKEPADDF